MYFGADGNGFIDEMYSLAGGGGTRGREGNQRFTGPAAVGGQKQQPSSHAQELPSNGSGSGGGAGSRSWMEETFDDQELPGNSESSSDTEGALGSEGVWPRRSTSSSDGGGGESSDGAGGLGGGFAGEGGFGGVDGGGGCMW